MTEDQFDSFIEKINRIHEKRSIVKRAFELGRLSKQIQLMQSDLANNNTYLIEAQITSDVNDLEDLI